MYSFNQLMTYNSSWFIRIHTGIIYLFLTRISNYLLPCCYMTLYLMTLDNLHVHWPLLFTLFAIQ